MRTRKTKTFKRLFSEDELLLKYRDSIEGRHQYYEKRLLRLTSNGKSSLSDFANGHMYYGLHRMSDGRWVFREWLPYAERVFLIGEFNGWKEDNKYSLKRINDHGDWEGLFSSEDICHGQLYRMKVYWKGGIGERLPAWTRRVVQNPVTLQFSSQVWSPDNPYTFKCENFCPSKGALFIYECHIGMATSQERVGTYDEFRINVLPRIAKLGYNVIQIMAVQEHPYYGSFGYHVSNFFAPSSRFGTPDQLKHLIDEAHKMGIAVIMDLVQSHAVKNTVEGIGELCGKQEQFFHGGKRGIHPAWDSLCFNYGSDDVVHFLLSNCKYWLEEFHFDGFRFDGVTSMIYLNHGLGQDFTSYGDYYNLNEDGDAISYLTLANQLIHEVNPHAITIAEEMSGMPGLASPIHQYGIGFDYRLAMGIPDYWIRLLKEKNSSEWNPEEMYWTLLNHREEEKTISYVESHDQALVGDKTLIFRLLDSDMYWHLKKGDETKKVIDGIAIHKMITLMTMATCNGGFLNFMGNEFGHPEWIDFPREGNGWSYKHALRRWDLANRDDLLYRDLLVWHEEIVKLLKSIPGYFKSTPNILLSNPGDQVLAFERTGLLFVFNFSSRSYKGYRIPCDKGAYSLTLSSVEAGEFDSTLYSRIVSDGFIFLSIPSYSVVVFRNEKTRTVCARSCQRW